MSKHSYLIDASGSDPDMASTDGKAEKPVGLTVDTEHPGLVTVEIGYSATRISLDELLVAITYLSAPARVVVRLAAENEPETPA